MEVLESPCFIHRGSVWHLYGDEDMIFSARSGSCTLLTLLHTKKVKTWLQERSIQVLDWPANSSDQNIIEEVRNIMKRRMRNSHPTGLVKLKGLIANTWPSIHVQELESLAASMSKRIAAVIRAKDDLLECHFYCFLIKKVISVEN